MRNSLPPWLDAGLQQLLQSRAHALLLHGPSGLGQWLLGQTLAASALCEAPLPDGSACGECPACHLFQAHTHPDCYYLVPESLSAELSLPLSEKQQEEFTKRKPRKTIGIESVREVVAQLQQTNARGQAKVVLIYPAEAMSHDAANAFLKTLEEPSGQTRMILISHASHRLLPTTRSRCLSYAMPWPSEAAAQAWLQSQAPQQSASKIALALQASGGRPLDASAWLHEPLIEQWEQLPQHCAMGHASVFQKYSPALVLDVLQKLNHDLWCRKVLAEPRYFPAAALPRAPNASALMQWSQQLMHWGKSIEHAYRADLLITDMLAQTARMWLPTALQR